jgi:hypothetical protein
MIISSSQMFTPFSAIQPTEDRVQGRLKVIEGALVTKPPSVSIPLSS